MMLGTLALVGLFMGCSEVDLIMPDRRVDRWTQTPTDKVDILWVIDNSDSMQREQQLLRSGFMSVAAELENARTDFHLGVITTDVDADHDQRGRLIGEPPVLSPETPDAVEIFVERALVGVDGSSRERGLEAAELALSPGMVAGPNRGFLRDDARLLVIVVSDEDDCSDRGALVDQPVDACVAQHKRLVPVSDFVASFRSVKSQPDLFRFGAIVGPEDPADAACEETTVPGRRYIDVVEATGGMWASVCEADWSSALYQIGLHAVGIFTTFELNAGAVPGTLVVLVDGAEVPEGADDGYTYTGAPPSVTFHGAWIPPRGASILASYESISGG